MVKVGVFDSGLGGLTIVKTMLETLNGIEVYYVADTQHAPYGEKTKEEILKYSVEITNYLLHNYNIDVLVVACNSATSAAIKKLREFYPTLSIIGTEPGLKPAMQQTQSKKVGILATLATLQGDKYKALLKTLSLEYHVEVLEQPCAGLVEQIEAGEITSEKTIKMLEIWLRPMREKGVDSIVLGCTHYPLVATSIKKVMQNETLHLIEVSAPITKRLAMMLENKGYINEGESKLYIYTTDKLDEQMVKRILPNFEVLERVSLM